MGTSAVGPWVKYQQQAQAAAPAQEQGPWTKYQSPQVSTGTSTGNTGTPPYYAQGQVNLPDDGQVTSTDSTPGQAADPSVLSSFSPLHPIQNLKSNLAQLPQTLKDYGIGAAKGFGHTVSDIDNAIAKLPYIGNPLTTPMLGAGNSQQARQQLQKITVPNGAAQRVGYGGEQVGEFMLPALGEEAATGKLAGMGGKLAKIAYGAGTTGLVNKAQGGSFGAGAAMGGIGSAAGQLLPLLKEPMQQEAVGRINKLVGATKKDFSHGADPGLGYFQGKLGTSSSMDSIANKAEAAKESYGEQIGDAIDNGTGAGIKIPALQGVAPIAKPIDEARAILSGPGGGSTSGIDDLERTFLPKITSAAQQGGFTPREYFDMKRNVARNTSWGDPTQIGLKQVRQQITGGMGGQLGESVPALKTLTNPYQNLASLSNRAGERAITGRNSLSKIGRGVVDAGTLITLGATHGPAGAAVGALPKLIGSVPVQTGIASGLYSTGSALSRLAPFAGRVAPATVLPHLRPSRNSTPNNNSNNK